MKIKDLKRLQKVCIDVTWFVQICVEDCNTAPLESPELYSLDQDGVLEVSIFVPG